MPRPDHILTDRERRFVEEYLVDLNKTQAAIRSGYSARTVRSFVARVTKRPRVRAAIEQAMAERARRVEVDQDRVVQMLATAAFGNPRTLFDADGELLPMHKLSDAVTALAADLDIAARIKDGGRKSNKKVEYVVRRSSCWDGIWACLSTATNRPKATINRRPLR